MTRVNTKTLESIAKLAITIAATLLIGCVSVVKPSGLNESIAIASGTVTGTARDGNGVLSFKGIPYAAPPIGPLRWRAPQPVSNWTETRSARAFGAGCWQSAPFDGNVDKMVAAAPKDFNEDCLFVNVWTPARERNDKLPVMVWLHGGGFQFGNGNLPRRGDAAPPLVNKGVVLVSLNYRLGVFGFFAHPQLSAESNGLGSGNYGMLDIVAALQWVKSNIAQFGGDPNKVTLFGNSAGAHAVGMLMASPLSRGLFQQAIGQSGAFWESDNGEPKRLAQIEPFGVTLASKLGASSLAANSLTANSLTANSLDAMRRVDALSLQKATNWTFAADPTPITWSPIIDGHVLPDSAYQRFAKGQQNDVPLLVGWNASEGFPVFAARSLMRSPPTAPRKTKSDFVMAVSQRYGANADALLALYPATSDEQAMASANALVGDEIIAYQTWAWAVAQKRTGRAPVYAYYYEHRSPFAPLPMHISEVPFVFNDLSGAYAGGPPPQSPAAAVDLQLADRIASYWSNFAKTGNPNGAGLPNWPAFDGAGSQVMRLKDLPAAGSDPSIERYRMLHKIKGRQTAP